jgi:transposase
MPATVYRRCCGIDVHKKTVSVHVLPPDGSRGEDKSRVFRTFRRDLKKLRLWLQQCKVTAVVMESTGQYWRPVWNVLEDSIPELVLMNPQHVRGLRGRKTDPADAKWLAGHLARGELTGSFVAPRPVRELRELTRLRVHLLQDINRVKNRIGQLCETMNIKINSVASDLFGLSGRRMLQGLVEGKRDAAWMADWAAGTLRRKRAELRLALDSEVTPHQRELLARQLRQLRELEQHVAELTDTMEQRMAGQADLVARLKAIPGVDRIVAWAVLAEIGWDMSVFADSRHLASWAALCPGNRDSGGKQGSGRTRKGNPYLRRVLCQAAWAAARTKNTVWGPLYRRYRARLGHAKAIMALAHRLLVVIYHILAEQGTYRELGADFYQRKQRDKLARKFIERLNSLGFEVSLTDNLPPPFSQLSDSQTG